MALRIRFQFATGATLGYSIERLSDGLLYDFSASTFGATPAALVNPLPEDSGPFKGRYKTTLASTSQAQFSNGSYAVTIHDTSNSNAVIGELGVTMLNGDDQPLLPVGGTDPWSIPLPGGYAAGTAGAILGQNLDAKVSTRSTFSGGAVASVTGNVGGSIGSVAAGGIAAASFASNAIAGSSLAADAVAKIQTGLAIPTVGQIVNGVWDEPKAAHAVTGSFGLFLDAAISTRSVFAGGPVASVTAPVTVGQNNDKAGYTLSAAGLDAVPVEGGINARQALCPILAAASGILSGAGTGTITIRGANVATTRITATTDNAGNRLAVTLSLPS